MRSCQSTDSEREVHGRRPGRWRQRLAPWLLALLAACGDDGRTTVCFGTNDFCDRAFADNRPPVAVAGDDQEVAAGDSVTLEGGDSYDQDGHIEDFTWAQVSGPAVALSGSTTASASFTAPAVTDPVELTFRLVVRDDEGESDADTTTVRVVPATQAAIAAGLALLSTHHRPDRLAGDEPPSAALLGLWLGALAEAGSAEADLVPLLDELRLVETLWSDDGFAAAGPAARRLLVKGHLAVARFTAERDPATAELAMEAAQRAGFFEPEHSMSWSRALAAWQDDTGLDEQTRRCRAERLLLHGIHRATAEQVAAATVLLAAGTGAAPLPCVAAP